MARIIAQIMGQEIPVEIPGGIKRGPTFDERFPGAPAVRAQASWWAAKEHLQRFRPKEYAELVSSGKLESTLDARIEAMLRERNDLLDSGLMVHEADEIVDRNYVYLPAEPGLEEEED